MKAKHEILWFLFILALRVAALLGCIRAIVVEPDYCHAVDCLGWGIVSFLSANYLEKNVVP
jgi:hypothetical protein